jgi:hypothetical protein
MVLKFLIWHGAPLLVKLVQRVAFTKVCRIKSTYSLTLLTRLCLLCFLSLQVALRVTILGVKDHGATLLEDPIMDHFGLMSQLSILSPLALVGSVRIIDHQLLVNTYLLNHFKNIGDHFLQFNKFLFGDQSTQISFMFPLADLAIELRLHILRVKDAFKVLVHQLIVIKAFVQYALQGTHVKFLGLVAQFGFNFLILQHCNLIISLLLIIGLNAVKLGHRCYQFLLHEIWLPIT